MSGEKTAHVSINTGGGAVSIEGAANVGSILETSATQTNSADDSRQKPLVVEGFDVFISYARPDRQIVDEMAQALAAEGLIVWYDRELQAGDQFLREINARLGVARWVLVVWSEHSIHSEWVLNEAEIARRRGVLVAVRISDVMAPAPFTLLDSPHLSIMKAELQAAVQSLAHGFKSSD